MRLLDPFWWFANHTINKDGRENPATHPPPAANALFLQNDRAFVAEVVDGERKTDNGVITNSDHSARADDRLAFDAQFIQFAADRVQKRFRLSETFDRHDAGVER